MRENTIFRPGPNRVLGFEILAMRTLRLSCVDNVTCTGTPQGRRRLRKAYAPFPPKGLKPPISRPRKYLGENIGSFRSKLPVPGYKGYSIEFVRQQATMKGFLTLTTLLSLLSGIRAHSIFQVGITVSMSRELLKYFTVGSSCEWCFARPDSWNSSA